MPLTRWASPRRNPTKAHIYTRITAAGLRGQPTGPSGAATTASAQQRTRLLACCFTSIHGELRHVEHLDPRAILVAVPRPRGFCLLVDKARPAPS